MKGLPQAISEGDQIVGREILQQQPDLLVREHRESHDDGDFLSLIIDEYLISQINSRLEKSNSYSFLLFWLIFLE